MIESSNYARVLTAYALAPPVEVFILQHQGNSTQNIGMHTGAGEFILRTYRSGTDVDTIRYEHRLLLWLAEAGLSFAVPIPVPTLRGETLIQAPQGWQALFPRLPGSALNRRDPAQIKAFGSALGELHTILSHYPTAPRPGVVPIGALPADFPSLRAPFPLRQNNHEHVAIPIDEELLGWWQEEITELRTLVETHYRRMPWQVIHNDFIPNNTLFSASQVTAVLDFEFTTPDVRVLDLAIGLRNMLRVWEQAEPWQTVRRFCAGYSRWIQLSEEEIAAVAWLMRLRNIWLVLRRMGKARNAQEIHSSLEHIKHAQMFARWLAVNERPFVDIIHQRFSNIPLDGC